MYLRIEQLRLREGAEATAAEFFREEALPSFDRTPGCRFAAFLAPWHASSHLGLTLWESDDRARSYERSALFQFYLGRLATLLEESPDEAQTADPDSMVTVDPNATLDAIAESVPIVGFRTEDHSPLAALVAPHPARFVRVTEIRIEPTQVEAFGKAFRERIAPRIGSHSGCAGALLLARVGDESELRSVSIWDREESAVRYELSGDSKILTDGIAGLLSPVYDWRLTPADGIPLRRRDLDVTTYVLVGARSYA